MRAAVVLSAYFYAEQVRAVRRMALPRLAIAAAVWLVIALLWQSRAVTLAGLSILATAGVLISLLEWRADRRLSDLTGSLDLG